MRTNLALLPAIGALAAAGCAANRAGVVGNLPPPLFHIPAARVTTPPAPVTATSHLPQQPRPLLPRRPSPSNWQPPTGISNQWKYIVIHHSGTSGGNAQRFDSYHRNVKGWDELGYHFVIGNGTDSGDGQVEVGSRWTKQKTGAHCKSPGNYYNEHGIGICLVGDFSRSGPTAAQMASLGRLVRFLAHACGIASQNIVTHRGVSGRTVCPGPKFPMDALRRSCFRAG